MTDREYRRMLRKMNFISDQDGIMTRYLRERENWDSHIQHCKNFIKNAFTQEQVKTVAVLGSGWLLDLPLEHLTEKFEKVVLVDIFHPPQVRKKLEKFNNCSCIELDITGGGIKFAWELFRSGMKQIDQVVLNGFKPELPALPFEPDAFISLNILNQLDILIIDFLKARDPRLNDDDLHSFRQFIQEYHIAWITQKPGCLISDLIEENRDSNGRMSSIDLLYTKLPKSFRSEQWIWDFDLSGFYKRHMQTKMHVTALEW